MSSPQFWWALVFFAALAAGLAIARVPMRLASLEGAAYDRLILALLLITFVILLHGAWLLTSLWNSLQIFLTCLDTLPIARAFTQPDGLDKSLPIWVRSLNLQSLDLHIRSLIILHDLSLMSRCPAPIRDGYGAYGSCAKQLLERKPKDRMAVVSNLIALRHASTKLARMVYSDIAVGYWTSEPLVGRLEGPSSGEGAVAVEGARSPMAIHGDPSDPGQLAETFLALHYTGFLLYAVRQLRNLILFLSVGFVLLAFRSPLIHSSLPCSSREHCWYSFSCLDGQRGGVWQASNGTL